eukprot:11174350-Lingulodinium_polyedra.AAC.1
MGTPLLLLLPTRYLTLRCNNLEFWLSAWDCLPSMISATIHLNDGPSFSAWMHRSNNACSALA